MPTGWAACPDALMISDQRGDILVFFGDSLISWSSKKEHVVARSSAESEYRSLAHTASELVWLRSLLTELSLFSRQPSTIWCDNVSAASLALAQALSS
ncbi:UNVERIFIED_CONTAM: Retrovirus-related Pol polyprotein from transposon RE2 [Sesamum radiatum]|uniref:Retrovirus-related Pol polyprotein from transposon RE2 n=1 Tax=Sesamum radiatum TaxID=300843 RepID=A0AAW2J4P3_SESRA